MRPIRLRLNGFTSFKDETEVSFERLDRFVISGPTGAGKSSLLDAMTFALFADAPRRGTGTLADLISQGRKSFSVSLDFSVGGQAYRVTRRRRLKGGGIDLLEKVTGPDTVERVAEGERAVTETVKKLLGLNYEHFLQAVFLPQGKFAEFLKAKPGERHRLLNELLRLLVFERMRARAAEDSNACSARVAQTERRLNEDFAGVTEEARAALEVQEREQLRIVEETDAWLPQLRQCWEEARRDAVWTTELETKRTELTTHERSLPAVDAARSELAASNRAANVLPLLEQADSAERESRRREEASRQAALARELRIKEHETASSALAQATDAARTLPDLRHQLGLLNVARGKLALRDQLARQLKEQQQRHATLLSERSTVVTVAERLTNETLNLDGELTRAQEEFAGIGFDEDQWLRLDSARSAAVALQADRRQFGLSREQAQNNEASAKAANHAAALAQGAAEAAGSEAAAARQAVREAAETLRAAEAADAATHLRAGLLPGDTCPVCCQEMSQVPAGEGLHELGHLREALAAAEERLVEATAIAARAGEAVAAARATAAAAQTRSAESSGETERREQMLVAAVAALLEAVGDLPDHVATLPVEDQTLVAVARAVDRQVRSRRCATRISELQTSLALKQKDRESLASEQGRLNEALSVAADQMADGAQTFATVRQEILDAAGSEDPCAESERVEQAIARLETETVAATQAERESSERLRLAESQAEVCAREAAEAARQAADAAAVAVAALREGGFPDNDTARGAFRTPQQVLAIQAQITEHEATTRALAQRIAELETMLQGRRVTAEDAEQAEMAHVRCERRRKLAETEAAVLGQQLTEVEARLERALQLRKELSEVECHHRVADRLARDLRTDRFQAYVLEETLVGLVGEASIQLGRLTGERYGLAFEDDRILAIDNDNASERRCTDTLSGGETFLASLALALALSAQVQKAAGAVHLDSLFIDEGFGTLDPETLRTVSDAIRALQVGGRMVGIITHVPELKEEFDQRLVVLKTSGSSSVQYEVEGDGFLSRQMSDAARA
jgi:exonuclease SbcC